MLLDSVSLIATIYPCVGVLIRDSWVNIVIGSELFTSGTLMVVQCLL